MTRTIPIGTIITRNGFRVEKRSHGWVDAGCNEVLVDESKIISTKDDVIRLLEQAIKDGDQLKALHYLNKLK